MGRRWARQWFKIQYNGEKRHVTGRGRIDAICDEIYEQVISKTKSMSKLIALEGNQSLLVKKSIGFQ